MRLVSVDYFRIILSLLVVFQHTFELSKTPYFNFHELFGSKFAVDSFFVLSGFLVFNSFIKNPRIGSYFLKRFLRIYPAYIFSIVFFSLFLFLIFPNVAFKALFDYFLPQVFFLNFLKPTINGVFDSNNIQVVNGALWTLKIEVLFYLVVPLIYYLIKKFNYKVVLLLLFLFSIVWDFTLLILNSFIDIPNFIFHQFPSQLKYFAIGIFISYSYPLNKSFFKKQYLLWPLVIYIISYFFGLSENLFLRPILLGAIIFSLSSLPFNLKPLKNDLSYGLYICHFPIIQLFVYFFPGINILYLFLFSISTATLFSYLLWTQVERPFIYIGKRWI